MIRSIIKRLFSSLLVLFGVLVILFLLFHQLSREEKKLWGNKTPDNAWIHSGKPGYLLFFPYLNNISPVSFHDQNSPGSLFYLNDNYKKYLKIIPLSGNRSIVLKVPNLGRSTESNKPVASLIAEKSVETTVLVVSAILLAAILGIIIGILAAIRKGSWLDRLATFLSMIGISLPYFVLSIAIAWLFGFILHRFTGLDMAGGLMSIDPFEGEYINFKNLVLPAFTLAIRPLAFIIQFTRDSLLAELNKDYALTARAKGMSPSIIIYKHALQNALNPLFATVPRWLGAVLAGTIFVEYIFEWNGLGKLMVTAIEAHDSFLVMGILLIASTAFIILDALAALAYSAADPRRREK